MPEPHLKCERGDLRKSPYFALYASIWDTYGYKIKRNGCAAPKPPPRPARLSMIYVRGERKIGKICLNYSFIVNHSVYFCCCFCFKCPILLISHYWFLTIPMFLLNNDILHRAHNFLVVIAALKEHIVERVVYHLHDTEILVIQGGRIRQKTNPK